MALENRVKGIIIGTLVIGSGLLVSKYNNPTPQTYSIEPPAPISTPPYTITPIPTQTPPPKPLEETLSKEQEKILSSSESLVGEYVTLRKPLKLFYNGRFENFEKDTYFEVLSEQTDEKGKSGITIKTTKPGSNEEIIAFISADLVEREGDENTNLWGIE